MIIIYLFPPLALGEDRYRCVEYSYLLRTCETPDDKFHKRDPTQAGIIVIKERSPQVFNLFFPDIFLSCEISNDVFL